MRERTRVRFLPIVIALMAAVVPMRGSAQRVLPAAGAQASRDSTVAASDQPALGAFRVPAALQQTTSARKHRAPLWAPLASLALPGSGQLAMGQTRGVAYAVAEVYAALQVIEAAHTAKLRRTEYHRLALEVARNGSGPEGPWRYYESIEDFPASGRYNLTPGTALTPEPDASTFNGAQWQKARQLFWKDPDVRPATSDAAYQRSIEFYQQSAWGDQYLWSFQDHLLDWDLYKSTIARENQATRDITSMVGIIVANHLLSAVDALATVRFRTMSRGERRIEVTAPWPSRRSRR